jgi:hypothetical protein
MFRRSPPFYRKSVFKGSGCKKLSQHHLTRTVRRFAVVARCARARLPAGIPLWLPW